MSENTGSANPFTLASFPRAILHVDADAFFTSVEQALNPELKGKPVVTGKERGIVACASYEAKALGVKRPMRLWEAKRMLPQLICLPSDYEAYSLFSQRIFAILRRFTPDVQEYSIDEAFADISGLRRVHHTGYEGIGRQVKEAVKKEMGLTVSVGLSCTKTLAKIASGLNKPDGFAALPANGLHETLKTLPLEKVCGFGPNTVALLQKYGVRNVLDYVLRPEAFAKNLLGKIGVELWHELRGSRVYPVEQDDSAPDTTIGKCKTFTPPSSEKEFVRAQLLRNVESAFIKLRRHNLRAKGMVVMLRTQEFKMSGVEAQLDRPTSSTIEAVRMASGLFEQLFQPGIPYRLTGVTLFKLEPGEKDEQFSLFDDVAKIQSLREIDKVIDGVNAQYGKHTLHVGTSLGLKERSQHIADRGDVPRRKQELLLGETKRQHLNLPMLRIKI